MRLIDGDALLEQMKHRRDYVGRPSDPVCLVEDAPTIGCWISVKDRLPESPGKYQVAAVQAGRYRHITIVSFRGHFVMDGQRANWKVTHWMPLPELPKEGKDNE